MEVKSNGNKNIEKYILVVYTIYHIRIFGYLMESKGIPSWMLFCILTSIVICWMIMLEEYRTRKTRAIISTIAVQISVILYQYEKKEIIAVVPILITLCILSGLYEIKECVFVCMLFTVGQIITQVITAENILELSSAEYHAIFEQLVNVAIAELVVYIWVRERINSKVVYYEMIKELKAAERSKDDFLANVSHEIRTPVNTICGMSEIVLREEDPQKIREYLFYIQTAGDSLMSVVSDILDFSELQSGKMAVVKEAYNITSTVNDIINMTMAKIYEKKLELIVDCEPNIPCGLMGDAKKIQRVVMNLISNAIKFTESGGVLLSVTYRKEEYGANLSITVKDTGIGMDNESVERLFSSYNQVDTSRNRQQGGVGLGISISKFLVKAMGGIITVDSKFGKGTEIKIVIPQEIYDERPIVHIKNKERYRVAIYINMEQIDMVEVRDDYIGSIQNMLEKFKLKSQVCRNLDELKRREEQSLFTNIFISLYEYNEDMKYFDDLAIRTKVVVIISRSEEKFITNPNLLKVYKPFYVLTLASVLRGNSIDRYAHASATNYKFIAPEVHVLVVDDNVMNIKVIEKLLEKYQITIEKATSGQMALDKVDSKEYDFVFMDHMMPEMDGIETLHRIRKKPGIYCKSVPIIALTANAVAGARENFLEEGFSDFLEKPVTVTELERILKRTLAKEKIQFLEDSDEKNLYEHNGDSYAKEEAEKRKLLEAEKKEDKGSEKRNSEIERETIVKKKPEREKHRLETITITAGAVKIEEALSKEPNRKNNLQEFAKVENAERKKTEEKKAFEKEQNPKEEIKMSEELEGTLVIGDLDIESGCMYCGGEDGYISILEMHLESAAENRKQVVDLFKEENWKDYTISVHAIKSFMLSLGAAPLSEMAKKLELAGKENNISYIKENHEAMVNEYDRVTEEIRSHKLFCDRFTVEQVRGVNAEASVGAAETSKIESNLPELGEEKFEGITNKLIDAMYDLDADTMTELLGELMKYQYHGKELSSELSAIQRKVEMCDYISAADAMEKLKTQL